LLSVSARREGKRSDGKQGGKAELDS
jgi:hypothetical protein